MDFIENFDLNINKSVIDSIRSGNKDFRSLVKKNSKSALKTLKTTNKEINKALKESQKKIKASIRDVEKEINTTLGQIQDPSTLIDTTIRTGQRAFRANVMNPMNTYKSKFVNTLKSGYREKIIKPLAIIDRGAKRGIVNTDVTARKLLRQIKPGNDIALRKYVLRPLGVAQNTASREAQKAYIHNVILPINYAENTVKKSIYTADKQFKDTLKQIQTPSTKDVDVYLRSQLYPINQAINETETSILSSTYSALKDYNTAWDETYVNVFNALIKSYQPNLVYKGESVPYMMVWSFFLLLALISQSIYDATIGNVIIVLAYLTGFDISGKGIKKSTDLSKNPDGDEPVTIVGIFREAGVNLWTKNSLVKKTKNIFYQFFLIIASIFDLITLAFINNATFFTDLTKALFGAGVPPP